MGLHTGEAQVSRTDYVGIDVHRAARIAAVAHGGQVLLSQTTYDLVESELPEGVAIRESACTNSSSMVCCLTFLPLSPWIHLRITCRFN
jgi:class 3 adenylate cyclase